MRALLFKNLGDRFSFTKESELLQLATLCDPRFKDAPFADDANEHKKAIAVLRNEMKVLQLESVCISVDPSPPSVSTSGPPGKRQRFSMLDALEGHLKSFTPVHSLASGVEDELTRYFDEERVQFKVDIFNWWAARSKMYPRIFQIANRVLVLPATSASSERVFSTCGNILTEKRSSTTGEHVNMIVFLNAMQERDEKESKLQKLQKIVN